MNALYQSGALPIFARRLLVALLAAACLGVYPGGSAMAQVTRDEEPDTNKLFRQSGKDPSFKKLVDKGVITVGKTSKKGVTGSKIDVNNRLVEKVATGKNPIPKDIRIHTIANSFVKREDFAKWTRWYQEDGNTQIFRLFDGEHNVRNKRPDAGRIESYSTLKWKRGDGWHAWEGTYTIVKAHGCMIFQVKNTENDWAVSIAMGDTGDIKLNHRRHEKDEIIARNMVGKPFKLGIRDNGHEYEVYLDNKKVGEGHYDRPKGHTTFRWGMYGKTFRHDAMIFVTGAIFAKQDS